MTYQEPSQPASPEAGSEPPASADVQPTTGNVLSGQGGAISGVTGPAGSDDTFDADGNLVVQGQYGTLTIDAQGNYTYVPNPDAPEGVQDVFTYTITDSSGAISTATLTVGVGGVADAAAEAGDTAIPGNVINLPAGVDISDIRVSGNDLIISLPDGSQMTIPNGALFVPRLVAGDIEIPQSSIAALLIESEPDPETGQTPSSGGNFGLDAPPLDPGVPLGDLVPPTEPEVTPPEDEEVIQDEDTQPTVLIFTPDVPAGAVNATASVDESGLPARDGEPEGTLEPQNIETTTGTINFTADDGLASVTINGVVITAVGQQIVGANGILTITSINLATGEIGFSYTVTDNTTDGVDDFEDFSVVVTDVDGDTAIGTLHIDIADDEPIARDDTDTVGADEQTATGNVMTGAGTTSGAPGADTVGADNATLTAVSGADGSDATFDADGNLVVHGQYGTLTIDAQGNYTYVLDEGAPDNVQDVFVYTLTDGDGDTETATLTITVPDFNSPPVVTTSAVNVSEEGLVGGNPDNTGTPDTTNSSTVSGNIGLSDPDSDATTVTLGIPAGSFESGGEVVNWVVSADGHTLIGYTGSDPNANHVIEVTIDNAGNYEVVLLAPFDDPNTSIEDSISFTIPVTVSDGTETVPTTILVTVEDDAVVATNDVDTLSEETLTATGNVITGAGTTNPGPDSYGADGPGSLIAVSGAGGSDSTFDAEGNLVVQGQYGTLTIDADGNYTYVLNEGAPDNVQDVFTYTLVDGDGDTDTATLTIIIPEFNSVPQIGTPENLSVDEDGLATANGDEGQTNPDEDDHGANASDSGTVSVDYGNDQPADPAAAIAFINPASLNGQLTQGGQPITFSIDGSGNLIGQVNGEGPVVVTIAFTTVVEGEGGQVTYGYQVTLSGPVDQAYPNGDQDEDGITLTGVQFQVTDSDGETDSGSFNVTIFDDVPSADSFEVTQEPEDATIVVDITVGLEAGADGVDLAAVTYDVTQGNADNLSYNSETGEFTYDPDPGEEGDVVFTYTVVDGDGDEITQTVTIHLVEDSVPQIGEAPALTVDEDGLATANDDEGQTDPDEDDHGANATDSDTVTVNYGSDTPADVEAAFAFINPSSLDGQLTQGGQPITFSIDGSGNIIGQVNGEGPAVVTITMSGAIDNGDGTVEYTYDVTLAGPVDQAYPDGDQDEDGITLTGVEFQVTDSDGSTADGSFNVTIFDDVPSAEVDQEFELPTLVVDESPIGEDEGGDGDPDGVRTATADFSGAFETPVLGADGEGSIVYSLSLNGEDLGSGLYALGVDGAQGDEIMLVENPDGTISGMIGTDVYFTISVDAETGEVTFEQFINVYHADDASDDDTSFLNAEAGTILLTQTVTDADGDTATASVDLSDDIFQIEDDGPSNGDPETELPTLVVDESALGEDEGGDSDPAGLRIATADFSTAFAPVDLGTDGEGSIEYVLSLNGEDLGSGLYALGVDGAQGDEIMLVENPDGTISGMIGTDVYFTISVDAETGEVTFEQFLNVYHGDTGDDDDTSTLSAAAGTITLDQVATDADGDTQTATIDLSDGIFQIEDDGPSTGTPDTSNLPTLTVDESPVDEDEGGDSDPAGVRTATADFSTAFAPVDLGTDGEGSVAYSLSLNGSDLGSGLYALDPTDTDAGDGDGYGQGDEIMLVDNGDGTISGVIGDDVYFTISVDAETGEVTFEQLLNVYHADPADDDDTSVLSAAAGTITLVQTATDADGDTATASIDLSDGIFNIEDDGPLLGAFEDADIPNEVGSVDGTYVYNWGTDGLGELTVTGPDIEGIVYTTDVEEDGTVILHGMAGTTEVFNLEVHPDGTYTFNLLAPDEATDITYDLTNLESGNANFTQTPDGRVEFTPLDNDGNDTGSVNSSNVGFGNGNQFTGNGEAITLEFHSTNQAGDQAATTNPDYVNSVAFTVPANGMNGSTVTLTWYAYNTSTGQMESGTIVVNDSSSAQQIVIDPSISFNVLVIEGSDADGQGVRLTELTVSQTILPQDQDLDFTIQATDADGDPTGTSTLSVSIDADAVLPLSMMATQETQETSSSDMSAGLVPSNDNEGFQRALASGSNAALMGAIAAVGLAETRGVHIEQLIANSIGDSPMAEAQQIVAQALAGHSTGQAEAGILLQQPGDSLSAPTAQNGGGRFQEVMDARGMDSHVRSDVARDLTQSTDAGTPAQEAVATTLTAASVAMPSADQMMDAPVSQVAPVQGSLTGASDSVGKVLADALQGGDAQGPNLDALINALPDHGGGGSAALEALASHGGGAVPNGHMADLAGFAGGRNAAIIDEMEVHQDALPPNG